jgi:hypothetical protein
MEAAFHHLAQVNIARMRAPLNDPAMHGFASRIAEINQLAESSPGYVWRWTDPDNGPYNAPDLLFNLSVWESVDALRAYVYRSPHVELFRGRAAWFLPFDGPSLALWWVPGDQRPTPAESKARLDHLTTNGPTPFAFSFKQPFPPT